jgi:hypothetical protein
MDIAHILMQENSEQAERDIQGAILIMTCTSINLGSSIESPAFVEYPITAVLHNLTLCDYNIKVLRLEHISAY